MLEQFELQMLVTTFLKTLINNIPDRKPLNQRLWLQLDDGGVEDLAIQLFIFLRQQWGIV